MSHNNHHYDPYNLASYPSSTQNQQYNKQKQERNQQQQYQGVQHRDDSQEFKNAAMSDYQFQEIKDCIRKLISEQIDAKFQGIKPSLSTYIDTSIYELKTKVKDIQLSHNTIISNFNSYNQQIKDIKQQQQQQQQNLDKLAQKGQYYQYQTTDEKDIQDLKIKYKSIQQSINEMREEKEKRKEKPMINISEPSGIQNILMEDQKKLKDEMAQLSEKLKMYNDDYQQFKTYASQNILKDDQQKLKNEIDQLSKNLRKYDDDHQKFKLLTTQDLNRITNKNGELEQINQKTQQSLQTVYNEIYNLLVKQLRQDSDTFRIKQEQQLAKIYNFFEKSQLTNDKVEEIFKHINKSSIENLIKNVEWLILEVNNLKYNQKR